MLLEKRIDIPNSWYMKLKDYIESDNFTALAKHIKDRRAEVAVYPPSKEIFRAFQLTPYSDVRVVVMGMDPYPSLYQEKPVACGLSFAPRDRTYIPPSLRKIYERLKIDFYSDEMTFPVDLDMEYWAKQGVLMLNAALTVEHGKAGSHMKLWEAWTEKVIEALNEYSTGIIFCLWGKDAQAFEQKISKHHIVLTAEHPVAANYQQREWNCDHFKQVNNLLMKYNGDFIDWIKT